MNAQKCTKHKMLFFNKKTSFFQQQNFFNKISVSATSIRKHRRLHGVVVTSQSEYGHRLRSIGSSTCRQRRLRLLSAGTQFCALKAFLSLYYGTSTVVVGCSMVVCTRVEPSSSSFCLLPLSLSLPPLYPGVCLFVDVCSCLRL